MQTFPWMFILFTMCVASPALSADKAKANVPNNPAVKRESSFLFTAGLSQHSGSLISTASTSTFNLGFTTLSHVPQLDVHELWSTGVSFTSLTSFGLSVSLIKVRDNSPFPFVDAIGRGDEVTLGTFSFGKLICFSLMEKVQICPGVEIAYHMIFPNDSSPSANKLENEQNYGSLLYDLRIGHYLGNGVKGGFEIQNFSVDQVVQDKRSGFSVTTLRLSLGFTIPD